MSTYNSVQFSRSVVSDSLQPHELQHARPPCLSPTPRAHSNSHPLSWWCHPAISSSVIPFSSCPQSLPASESFPLSQLFAWRFEGGQSIGVSALASFLPKNTQDWFPLEWTGWISLQSKGLYTLGLSVSELPTDGIIEQGLFCVWLLLRNIMSVRFIHVIMCTSSSPFFMAVWYFIRVFLVAQQ